MKLTKIALAVACLVGSVQAFAAVVTPAQISAAQSAGTLQQAWISGASASAKVFMKVGLDQVQVSVVTLEPTPYIQTKLRQTLL